MIWVYGVVWYRGCNEVVCLVGIKRLFGVLVYGVWVDCG